MTSGTAAGHGSNDADFTDFRIFQKSIFQQLSENNITWSNYGNTGGVADANFYNVGLID
ncbi:MAG TPA: hypothetical protein VGO47_14265 [Chlamydiales bacterium]|nr:hypothetical protein [Chlamydiales bacterium]